VIVECENEYYYTKPSLIAMVGWMEAEIMNVQKHYYKLERGSLDILEVVIKSCLGFRLLWWDTKEKQESNLYREERLCQLHG
jgi:hypothetical protein